MSAIGLDHSFPNWHLFSIETTYWLHRAKSFSIGELSVIFRDRDLGDPAAPHRALTRTAICGG